MQMITSYLNLLVTKLFIDCNFLFKWFNELLFWVDSLLAQMVKNLPAMQETWVRSLGGEDPLEKEMATHSGILAWRIPWTEECGGLQFMGSQRVRHNWATSLSLFWVECDKCFVFHAKVLGCKWQKPVCLLWEVVKRKTLTRLRVTHSTSGKAREHIVENHTRNNWVKAAKKSAGLWTLAALHVHAKSFQLCLTLCSALRL